MRIKITNPFSALVGKTLEFDDEAGMSLLELEIGRIATAEDIAAEKKAVDEDVELFRQHAADMVELELKHLLQLVEVAKDMETLHRYCQKRVASLRNKTAPEVRTKDVDGWEPEDPDAWKNA